MSTLVVTGGSVSVRELQDYLENRSFEHVIAVDAGILAAEQLGLAVDYLVGDFDTLGEQGLARWENTAGLTVQRYNPKKDETDTEIAVCLALALEKENAGGRDFFPEQVVFFGATGTRLDHTLANLFLLARFEQAGLSACIVDANNRISVHHTSFSFFRGGQYGKYISFLALTPQVEGLTLHGFAYPLKGHVLKQESSLCISNEAVGEKLGVEFSTGRLLMVESMD